jgi:hypothetical protein
MQGAGILVFSQFEKEEPLADGLAPGKPFPKGVPALVRLDDGVDPLDAV